MGLVVYFILSPPLVSLHLRSPICLSDSLKAALRNVSHFRWTAKENLLMVANLYSCPPPHHRSFSSPLNPHKPVNNVHDLFAVPIQFNSIHPPTTNEPTKLFCNSHKVPPSSLCRPDVLLHDNSPRPVYPSARRPFE